MLLTGVWAISRSKPIDRRYGSAIDAACVAAAWAARRSCRGVVAIIVVHFVVAVTDIDEGQWNDERVLSTFVPAATRVTITDGQRTVQDLKIR